MWYTIDGYLALFHRDDLLLGYHTSLVFRPMGHDHAVRLCLINLYHCSEAMRLNQTGFHHGMSGIYHLSFETCGDNGSSDAFPLQA